MALESSVACPEIVKFSPWIISSRDGLLGELFKEIANASLNIDLVEPELPKKIPVLQYIKKKVSRYATRKPKRAKLSKRLKAFAGHLAILGKFASFAEFLSIPGAGTAKQLTQAASESVGSMLSSLNSHSKCNT